MVIGTTGAQQTNLSNSLNLQRTISSSTLESFEQQLTSAIASYLGKSGNGTQIEINIQPGQPAGSLNIDVTATPDPATPSTTTAADPVTTATTTAPVATPVTTALATPPATSTPAAPATAASTALTSGASSQITPTDAYWADQPTAVQALRYTPDDEKAGLAQQLANEGYSIDVPIMVWGWDPLATMIERQSAGYTWVPSALQPSVDVAPGVSMPGSIPYNPDGPPAGSIQVSTAFADGTNIAADPIAELWLQGQSSTASGTTATNS